MQTYQIDLDLLLESQKTYRKSAEELEEKIDESRNVLGAMDEDTYAGEDADTFRLMFSKHLEVYFVKTAERTKQVVLKLFFAHNTGKYCKKKCYDFIGAFGGGEGTKDTESFGGKLYCNLDMIVMLRGEANVTVAYGENINDMAKEAKKSLQELKIVPFDSEVYASRIEECCTKINQLEDYSARLTDYAELVETMDDNLQKGLRECIPEYYEMTADGVDDRQAYLQMEYNKAELERLLKIPEDELTDADRAKRDVMLMKLEELNNIELINKTQFEEKVIGMVNIAENEFNSKIIEENGINLVKYNTWYYGREVFDGDITYDDGRKSSYAWCSVFVLWCANESGLLNGEVLPELNDVKKKYFEGVKQVEGWYIENGRYHGIGINGNGVEEPNYIPEVGDFVVFHNKTSHIGIVAGYDEQTHTLYTYEGNSSNRVAALCYKEIDKKDYGIVGYCSNDSSLTRVPDNLAEFSDKTGGTTR